MVEIRDSIRFVTMDSGTHVMIPEKVYRPASAKQADYSIKKSFVMI